MPINPCQCLISMDDKYAEYYRENLPRIRACLGWSQTDLAEMLGVTRATISKLERKEGSMTPLMFYAIKYLVSFARIYDKDADIPVKLISTESVSANGVSREEFIELIDQAKTRTVKRDATKLREYILTEFWKKHSKEDAK